MFNAKHFLIQTDLALTVFGSKLKKTKQNKTKTRETSLGITRNFINKISCSCSVRYVKKLGQCF